MVACQAKTLPRGCKKCLSVYVVRVKGEYPFRVLPLPAHLDYGCLDIFLTLLSVYLVEPVEIWTVETAVFGALAPRPPTAHHLGLNTPRQRWNANFSCQLPGPLSFSSYLLPKHHRQVYLVWVLRTSCVGKL